MKAIDYPYQYHVEVIFNHLDAMGHVNNVTYFVFLETARIKYVAHLWGADGRSAPPIVLAKTTCSYLSPAFLEEQLIVGVGVSRLGNKSFDLVYQIETEDGRPIATAHSTQVTYDYASQQTIPIPDWFRQRVQTHQNDWQPPDLFTDY